MNVCLSRVSVHDAYLQYKCDIRKSAAHFPSFVKNLWLQINEIQCWISTFNKPISLQKLSFDLVDKQSDVSGIIPYYSKNVNTAAQPTRISFSLKFDWNMSKNLNGFYVYNSNLE